VIKMEREGFGIKEFDSMIEGGIPKNSIVGISGPPGVGKSIFSIHYIIEGARQGQKSVYINLEEPQTNIDKLLHRFGMFDEVQKFIQEGLIIIRCIDFDAFEKTYPELLRKIRQNKDIKRLVIDSFNCFFNYYIGTTEPTEIMLRRLLHKSISTFRNINATTVLTLEKDKADTRLSNFSISYLTDGHIMLDFLEFGTIERRVFIPKMRWTDQDKDGRNYEIDSKGIKILKEQ